MCPWTPNSIFRSLFLADSILAYRFCCHRKKELKLIMGVKKPNIFKYRLIKRSV